MNAAGERQNRSPSFFACSLLTADGFGDAGARAEDIEQINLTQAVLLHQDLETFVRFERRESRVRHLIIVNQPEQQCTQRVLFRSARLPLLQERLDQTRSTL
jgi:hypothetical protein